MNWNPCSSLMMNLMPEIITESRNGETVTYVLRVPPDLTHFAGHFPGFPILPGIVQIDWAVRLARRYLPDLKGSQEINNLKFLALVRPDAVLTLRLDYDASHNILQFSYRDDERAYSSGRIRFQHDA
jgi:3-hydroxymyristoyl/3-hydroxydecanoyl-(acyl carrier protein) dehydratase